MGFEGFRDYPSLLRAVQDVYAIRSISLATVAASLGTSLWAAVAVSLLAGLACVVAAAVLVRRPDGDRRSFAVVVAACILASSVVWPNYIALLLVPIAVTWPRLSPAWFLGYAFWLASTLAPKPTVRDGVCCKPGDVTQAAWDASHADPVPWLAAAAMALVIATTIV